MMTYFSHKHILLTLIFTFSMFGIFPYVTEASTLQAPPNNLGLVGYWSFDEGSGTQVSDLSGNGKDGTISGDPDWVPGKKGGALEFSGDNNQVSVGDATDFNFTTEPFTISVWAKTNTTAGGTLNYIMAKYAANSWLLRQNNANLEFFTRGTTGFATSVSNVFTVGEWVHIAAVYTGENGDRPLYINGSEANTNGFTGSITGDTTSPVLIGGAGGGSSSQRWDGQIDDVRIYNRALSADEVATLHNAGSVKKKVADNTGLVGHWTFDDGSGTVAGDASGNGNDGTLNGDPQWVSGKKGGALEFDGNGDYVSLGSNSGLSLTGDMTLSAWVNFNGQDETSNNNTIIKRGWYSSDAPANSYYQMLINGSEYLVFYTRGNSLVTFDLSEDVGEWVHLVCISDAGTTKCYRNGVVHATTGSHGTGTPYQDNATFIGTAKYTGDPVDDYFPGSIDDVRIYNRALSASEIQSIYEENVQYYHASKADVLTDGLVGYWDFDGPNVSGSTVTDVSGNGNDGTINGNASPTQGRLGQAFEFDGSTGFIYAGTADNLDYLSDSSQDSTWSVWFQTTSSALTTQLVNKYWPFKIEMISGAIRPIIYNGSSFLLNAAKTDQTFNDGLWHLATFVVDRDGFARLYMDGEEQDEVATDISSHEGETWAKTDSLTFADRSDNNRPSTWIYEGKLDDVRIYDRALSADEVKQLYNLGR